MTQPKELNSETESVQGNGEWEWSGLRAWSGPAPELRGPFGGIRNRVDGNNPDRRNGQKKDFGGVRGFEFDGETGQFVPVKTE